MKPPKSNIIIALAAFILVLASSCNNSSQKDTISISGAFALYPLTVKWAEEYQKIHPEITIDVSAGGAGKGMTDVLSGMVDLAMFSRTVSGEELSKGAWPIAVARDAVVATFNSSNPCLQTMLRQGITKEQFADLFVNKKILKWNQLVLSAKAENINLFTRSDACGAAEMWAKFLGSNQESLAGIGVFGDPGIADAVKNDKLGIGYNNVVYAYDGKSRKPYEGMQVIPLDINGNGKIDPDEDFYSTLDKIMQAIADDKYPSPPARDLYLISRNKPTKKTVADFLDWILTAGQKMVREAGYVQLKPGSVSEQQEKLSK